MSQHGKAIIFSAPSGAGKTTLVHHLLNNTDLQLAFSISATTRAKRSHEEDGKDYYFLQPNDFLSRAKNGELAYASKFDTIIVNDILEDAMIQAELQVSAFLQKP